MDFSICSSPTKDLAWHLAQDRQTGSTTITATALLSPSHKATLSRTLPTRLVARGAIMTTMGFLICTSPTVGFLGGRRIISITITETPITGSKSVAWEQYRIVPPSELSSER